MPVVCHLSESGGVVQAHGVCVCGVVPEDGSAEREREGHTHISRVVIFRQRGGKKICVKEIFWEKGSFSFFPYRRLVVILSW